MINDGLKSSKAPSLYSNYRSKCQCSSSGRSSTQMKIPANFSTDYALYRNLTLIRRTQSFNFSSGSKSTKSYRKPRPKKPKPKKGSSPSLLQCITDIVGNNEKEEDPSFPLHNDHNFSIRNTRPRFPTVCENAHKTSPDADFDNTEYVNQTVHKITVVLRAESEEVTIEQKLDEMDIALNSEIVERVLKNCFKVGHLALRFFNWAKSKKGFNHDTSTYNAMICVAGEIQDFELLEKLVKEMDDESCSKDTKTWTILISRYGTVKKYTKALVAFEAMRKSGCKLDTYAYEAIIKALVNADKADLALEFYKEMVLKGIDVGDTKLYDLLMICLCRKGNVVAAREVGFELIKGNKVSEIEGYTRILRSYCITGKIYKAIALVNEMKMNKLLVDSYAYEVLLQGLCKAGKMDEAMKVVDEMKEYSLFDSKIYSFLVDGLLRKGNASKALELIHQMKELACVPTLSTYTQILQHLSKSGSYEKACEIYEGMVKNGIKPDIVAYTAMIAGHVQNNHTFEAFNLFEIMKSEGINPNSRVYSVFIHELIKASKPDEASKLLIEMVTSNVNVPQNLFHLVMSACLRTGNSAMANTLKEMSKPFKFDSCMENKQVHNSVIDSSSMENSKPKQIQKEYCDNDFKELHKILTSSSDFYQIKKDLERSNVSFTPELVAAILESCNMNGRTMINFFKWVGKLSSYKHTTETYNSAIKISGNAKDFKQMRELLRDMRRNRCSMTANTWTIMIAQYGKAGLTEVAIKTYKDMRFECVQPNASTYRYLIIFLCEKKGQKLEEAIEIFKEMIYEGFLPDKETVSVFLSSLCGSNKIEVAKKCLKYLFRKGFTKQVGYLLLVKSLCRAENLEDALTVIDEMKNDNCSIDQFVYGSVIHALLRKDRLSEALDKVKEMESKGIPQSIHIQTSFIVHYCKQKQIEKALEIYENISKPTLVTYSAMIRGYMNVEMVEAAWGVFERLRKEGPLPDFETYSMFISCLCKVGKSEDGLRLINEMLGSGIVPSAVNFRTVFHGLNREGKQRLGHSLLQTKWRLKRQRMPSL